MQLPRYSPMFLLLSAFLLAGCAPGTGVEYSASKKSDSRPIAIKIATPPVNTLPPLEGMTGKPRVSMSVLARNLEDAPLGGDGATDAAVLPVEDRLCAHLTNAGWMAAPAREVADLHAEWFELVEKDLPGDAKQQLERLASLGACESAQLYLEQWPECASLFATVKQPDLLARILYQRGDEERGILWAMYASHVGSEEANRLTTALGRHRETAVKLVRRGLVGAEVVFLVGDPLGDDENREYHDWLAEVMEQALAGSDEELAALVNFLLQGGHDLCNRLHTDAPFREKFRQQLWPALCRVAHAAKHPIHEYLIDEHLWDILLLDRGDRLLAKLGPAAAVLFFGDRRYPPELHGKLTEVVLAGNDETIGFLLEGRHRQNPDLAKLLGKTLTAGQLADVLLRVKVAEPDDFSRLRYFVSLRDDILQKDLTPPEPTVLSWIPLYDTGAAIYKSAIEGRELSAEDWIGIGLDAVDVAITIATIGSAKVVTTLGKNGAKTTVKGVKNVKGARKVAIAGKMFKPPIVVPAKSTIASGALAKSSAPVGMANWFGNQFVTRKTWDITQIVRSTYQNSGAGRQWFRRLTNLEARLFMRADARVIVQVDQIARPNVLSWFKAAANLGAKNTLTKEEEKVVRKRLAGWWTMNAGSINPEFIKTITP